jgi:hypothetical protein
MSSSRPVRESRKGPLFLRIGHAGANFNRTASLGFCQTLDDTFRRPQNLTAFSESNTPFPRREIRNFLPARKLVAGGDCGLRIADCGFKRRNPHGPHRRQIPHGLFNPQSAIRNPQSGLR